MIKIYHSNGLGGEAPSNGLLDHHISQHVTIGLWLICEIKFIPPAGREFAALVALGDKIREVLEAIPLERETDR